MSGDDPVLAIVEPWLGESHEVFVRGLESSSDLAVEVVSLPATKWKWRMRNGAWPLSQLLNRLSPWPDVFLFSDYVNLPALMGFCPGLTNTPRVVYFHENQITYPLRRGTRRDFEFCSINVLTCLAADRCVFCSRQQLDAFLEGIPPFLEHDDAVDASSVVDAIRGKSSVIPVGVDLALFDGARGRRPDRAGLPLRIVWPHRFEHDKNPDDFFQVLFDLADERLEFEISVLGRSYRDTPPIMEEARGRLKDCIVQWDFLTGADYADALAAADVVVSTAWQETLGLAVIEAIRAGCDPLLPNRLSYPEVLGDALCEKHLYQNKGELRRRLRWMIRNPDRVRATSNHHAEMDRFSWDVVGSQFNSFFRELVGG